jgi:hypothetical protein
VGLDVDWWLDGQDGFRWGSSGELSFAAQTLFCSPHITDPHSNLVLPQITHSLLYAGLFTVLSAIPSLPLSAYNTFHIEEKHGFNKSSWGLWVTDQIKSYALGAVIGLPVLAAFLKIVDWAGDWFIPALMVFL